MKKIFVYILLLIYSNKVHSQEIKYTPPSPTAFNFVNDVKIDEDYKGAANVNIPILTLKNRNLSESISLSYHTAGVKVDDLPSDIGMSWILKAGGIITRTIYGEPDEQVSERLNYDEPTILNYLASDCSPNDFMRRTVLYSTIVDAQKDIFRFNVNGISGSFLLDESYSPKFLQNDLNVKIKMLYLGSVTTNNRYFDGFEITATDGTKYVFGGLGFVELSASTISHPPMQNPTAFYLNKVVALNGDSLNYYYDSEDLVSNNMMKIYTFRIAGSTSSSVDTQRLLIKNKKRISRIVGNNCNCSLIFSYAAKDNSEFKKYLDNIQYKVGEETVEKVSFDYLFGNQRFFLTKINYFKNNTFDKSYSFGYNNADKLPERLSTSQDMLGFYNGAYNTNLIAKPYDPFNAGTDMYASQFGDRKPNFNLSLYGSLRRITYPTGGYTEFEYEAPKAFDLQPLIINSEEPFVINASQLVYNSSVVIPRINYEQKIKINISAGTSSFTAKWAIFRIFDNDTNEKLLEKEIFTIYKPNYTTPVQTYELQLQQGKSYRLTLDFKQNYSPDDEIFFMGSYTQIREKVLNNYLGIRVKSKSDVLENGQKIYKRYYYRPAEFYDREEAFENDRFYIRPNSTLSLTNSANGSSTETITYSSTNTNPYYEVKNKNRYPIITYSLGGDNFENGGYEKHYQIDSDDLITRIEPAYGSGSGSPAPSSGIGFTDTQNGLINLIGYIYNHIYVPPHSNRTEFDGQLIKTKYYQNMNNNIYKIRQENTDYLNDINNEYCNLKISLILDDATQAVCDDGRYVERIGKYYIGLYKWLSIVRKINSSQTIEYKNPILLNKNYSGSIAYINAEETPDWTTEDLITTRQYRYETTKDYILKEKRDISTMNDQTNTNYLYAFNFNNEFLIEKNIIDTPLVTEIKKNGKTISRIETNYPTSQQDANDKTSGLPLPKSASSLDLLTGAIATDVIYNQYDSKGNLLQYTTKTGIPTAIVWGYNNTQPIAKIEGATYSQVSSLAGTIVTASDTDASAGVNNDETSLLDLMKTFREALPNYQVTTYTYDPLVGVRSITPPNGVRQVYIYDTANRLKEVREHNQSGNLLKEYQYNYKH